MNTIDYIGHVVTVVSVVVGAVRLARWVAGRRERLDEHLDQSFDQDASPAPSVSALPSFRIPEVSLVYSDGQGWPVVGIDAMLAMQKAVHDAGVTTKEAAEAWSGVFTHPGKLRDEANAWCQGGTTLMPHTGSA